MKVKELIEHLLTLDPDSRVGVLSQSVTPNGDTTECDECGEQVRIPVINEAVMEVESTKRIPGRISYVDRMKTAAFPPFDGGVTQRPSESASKRHEAPFVGDLLTGLRPEFEPRFDAKCDRLTGKPLTLVFVCHLPKFDEFKPELVSFERVKKRFASQASADQFSMCRTAALSVQKRVDSEFAARGKKK